MSNQTNGTATATPAPLASHPHVLSTPPGIGSPPQLEPSKYTVAEHQAREVLAQQRGEYRPTDAARASARTAAERYAMATREVGQAEQHETSCERALEAARVAWMDARQKTQSVKESVVVIELALIRATNALTRK